MPSRKYYTSGLLFKRASSTNTTHLNHLTFVPFRAGTLDIKAVRYCLTRGSIMARSHKQTLVKHDLLLLLTTRPIRSLLVLWFIR